MNPYYCMHLHEILILIDHSAYLKMLFFAVGIAELRKELTSYRMAQKMFLSEPSTTLVVLVLLCSHPSGSVIHRRHVTFKAPSLSSTSDLHCVANLASRSSGLSCILYGINDLSSRQIFHVVLDDAPI
jgi:hypothetical protein